MKYYSKTQVLILFSLAILSALLTIGCKKSGKRGAEGKGDQATAMPSSEAEYKGLKTVADSTYNGWHIIIQEANTDVKIENSDLFDKKALITISKDGKLLFDKEEFTTNGLHESLDNQFALSSGVIEQITNTSVYITLGAFIPETDEGIFVLLAFSKDGHFKKYMAPTSLNESDLITYFYIMYTHENLQDPVDKPSLQRIAKAYGTPSFVAQLEKNGPLSIYPPEVISRYKLNVHIESESLGSYGNSTIPCKALFYPHRSDNLISAMHVELKHTVGEEDGLSYIRINRISR